MKKQFLLIAVICCLFGLSANAQKYGHVNSGDVLKAMPGVDSLQIKMAEFQKELETIYENMVTEFTTKKDKFDKEAGTMSSSVRKIREQELLEMQNRIQEFQYSVQEDMEEKQIELLKPFNDKLQNAIKAVAKEHQYTYIFDTQILLYYDGGDDVTPLVKKKLGLK